ncbi:hypothetical protein [Dysgonomonas sp.]|jgi:hypothetical protein
MEKNENKKESNSSPDNRLGTPMKKIDGLSSDKKRAESEHLYVFRKDILKGENEIE